ncbi:MAG: YbhN family protein [bacterium]
MSKSVTKGIRIFVLITVLTSIVMLFFTVSEETWRSLEKIKPIYFLIALVLLLAYYYLDGLRIKLLADALGYKISVMTGIDVVVGGIFLAAVTPFQSGGYPFQVYCLNKRGIPYGEGTLILFMRGVLAIFFHIAALPFIFVTYSSLLENSIVKWLIRYIMVLYPVMLLIAIIAIAFPGKVVSFMMAIDRKFNKNAGKNQSKLAKAANWIDTEIKLFKNGLVFYFTKRRASLFINLALTFIGYILFFSLAAVILYALGAGMKNPVAIASLQFLHNFLVYFTPTPGASGIAEALFAILFKDICPKEILGLYAIIWRFFTFTIGACIGGFLTLKIVNQSGTTLDELMKDEKGK